MRRESQIAENRIGAVCTIAGSVLLLTGTYLHPMRADPNDPIAAFTEYAASRVWTASHLMQLAGVALIVAALVILARQLERESESVWPRLAAAGAIASLAMAAMLQAVDGVALKPMVEAWARASPRQKDAVFYGAFAVRQIEVGAASMLSLLLGATAVLYGVALLTYGGYPKWSGAAAIGGGAAMSASGVVMAYTGFSDWTMAINMPSSLALVVWIFVVGCLMWRRGIA